MFSIYINDLLTELSKHSITVKAFADDVKMYVQILDDLDVQLRLQLAVDVLTTLPVGNYLAIIYSTK